MRSDRKVETRGTDVAGPRLAVPLAARLPVPRVSGRRPWDCGARLAAAAILSAGLAACGGTPAGSGDESAVSGNAASVAREGSGPAGRASTLATILDSSEMFGWTATELHHRLGLPMLTFMELPAEVWRYSTPACVVLVFLYPVDATPGSPPVVHHVEVLPRAGVTDRDSAHCLQQIEELGTV